MRRLHGAASVALLPLTLVLGVLSGYVGLLTGAAWRALRRGHAATAGTGDPAHRILVLVPAHDEEQVIGETLDSLAELDYPAALFGVHVVADNCTDGTAALARARDVEVHERSASAAPGKGPALMWLLDRLWQRGEPHDAIAIIDADTIVSPNFLRVMDARLSRGDTVIQAYYAVRDPAASWAVALRQAALAVRHYLRPLARTALGSSAGLHGNGMVLAAAVMRDRTWTNHLAEDIEFEAELLLAGERVAFAPDAVVRAEMPTRLSDASSQHARWERGRIEVVRDHVPRLLRAALRGRPAHRLRCADAAVDHLVPPLSVLAMATGQALVASSMLWLARRTRLSRCNLALSVAAAAAQSAYVASGLRMVDAPPSVWRSLLHAPGYALWKVRLWASAAAAGDGTPWTRTSRNS